MLDAHYPAAPAETHREHYEERLNEAAEELVAQGFFVSSEVREGDPALELIEAARQAGAGVILAGSHGHGKLRELFMGSVILNLARLTDRPVWVEPTSEPASGESDPVPLTDARVLLATDGSPAAAAAEELFERLVPRVGHSIVLHVLGRSEERRVESDRARIDGHFEALTERMPSIEPRINQGLPEAVIAEAAYHNEIDLVVIGKRGHNAIRDILLGSTVEGVCRRTNRPVLIVPPGSRAEI